MLGHSSLCHSGVAMKETTSTKAILLVSCLFAYAALFTVSFYWLWNLHNDMHEMRTTMERELKGIYPHIDRLASMLDAIEAADEQSYRNTDKEDPVRDVDELTYGNKLRSARDTRLGETLDVYLKSISRLQVYCTNDVMVPFIWG